MSLRHLVLESLLPAPIVSESAASDVFVGSLFDGIRYFPSASNSARVRIYR